MPSREMGAADSLPGVSPSANLHHAEVAEHGPVCGQVRSEALAAAQERLEATKVALERRRDELRALEREVREAARSADAAGKAAAARNAELLRKEVHYESLSVETSGSGKVVERYDPLGSARLKVYRAW